MIEMGHLIEIEILGHQIEMGHLIEIEI